MIDSGLVVGCSQLPDSLMSVWNYREWGEGGGLYWDTTEAYA